MFDQTEVKHHIQKYILGVLLLQRTARFRDMRPPRVDTNLYSYHLTRLLKEGLVTKVEGAYTLDFKGLVYVDRLNTDKLFVRSQPKIITMLVLQNGNGDVLMYKKRRQPFIEKWTIPNGKVHNDDVSIAEAAEREVREKIVEDMRVDLRHVGDCYIRTMYQGTVATTMLAHVYWGTVERPAIPGHLHWVKLRELDSYETGPAVKEIIARTLFHDPFFFEEFEQSWS